MLYMENEQLNIRISQELLRDLEIIAKLLKVNRSEWIKTRLAEKVSEEKNRLLIELSTLYSKGMVSKNDVESLVGRNIADEMEFIKKKAVESIRKGREYGRRVRKKIRS
jgi:metal-responsive CopG/Arc/MetJ family transcriptional regulator